MKKDRSSLAHSMARPREQRNSLGVGASLHGVTCLFELYSDLDVGIWSLQIKSEHSSQVLSSCRSLTMVMVPLRVPCPECPAAKFHVYTSLPVHTVTLLLLIVWSFPISAIRPSSMSPMFSHVHKHTMFPRSTPGHPVPKRTKGCCGPQVLIYAMLPRHLQHPHEGHSRRPMSIC